MERATPDRRDRFSFEQQRRRPFGSTDRKENHGYCQESFKEIRKEVGCKKAGRKETRRKEICKESYREEGSRQEGRAQEDRSQAQTQCGIHESDDALLDTRGCGRHLAAAAH